jgi:hypothetical protein
MHAYTWYLWKTQRTGPSLKIRVGKDELLALSAAVNLPNALSDPSGRHRMFASRRADR